MEELKNKVAIFLEGDLDDDIWGEVVAKGDVDPTWSVEAAAVAVLKTKHVKLQEANIKLQEANKQAQEDTKQAQERTREFQDRLSIGGLLRVSSETLALNPHMRGPTKSDVNQNHEKAKRHSVDKQFVILSEIPMNDSQMLDYGSLMMAKLDHGRLTYSSEFDVQDHVHAMISDALKIVNHLLEGSNRQPDLIVRREASLFTNKPDHSVILDNTSGAPVLCIETKMPLDDNQGPHEKVLGQVFDYVSWMRNFGHPNPFAVLTTFDQTWITWDAQDEQCFEIAKEANRLDSQKLASLRSRFPTSTTTKTPSPSKPEEPKTSPAAVKRLTKKQKTDDSRTLAMFGPIKPSNMITALVNAVLCSLQNFSGVSLVPNLQPGTMLQHQVLTMNAKSYRFESIKLQVKKWDPNAMKAERVFHITSLLGAGRTSKAFRAVSGSGYECVLKVYVRSHDETNNYQKYSLKDFNKAARSSTRREQERYHRIYKLSIPTVTLNGLSCLVLPYFESIPKGSRIESLEAIRNTLKTNFDFRTTKRRQGEYLRYSDTDISWRHCGFLNGKLYLFDLADLEACKEENNGTFDRYVTHHVERLKERTT